MKEEKQFKYTESFIIRTYDADFKRRAKGSAILGYMQEVATKHAQLIGLGYKDSMEHGFFWVIGRTKYMFKRMPKLYENLEVTTWPAGVDGICALRRFEFRVGKEVIGEGLNYWLMLDKNRFRPIKPDYFLEMTKDLPIEEEDYFQLKKEMVPKDMQEIFRRTMRSSDLDWNNHVNNVRYGGLVYDSIPYEMLEKYDIGSMQINYLKELKIGDEVFIKGKYIDEKWFVEGCVGTKTMFSAVVEFI